MKNSLIYIFTLLLCACATSEKVDHTPYLGTDIDIINLSIEKQFSPSKVSREELLLKLDSMKLGFPNIENLPSSLDIGEKEWQPPKVVKLSPPMYERERGKDYQEGEVLVLALIAEDGKVVDTQVYKSTNNILNQSAVLTLGKWQFSPATLDGKPCKSVLGVPVHFRAVD